MINNLLLSSSSNYKYGIFWPLKSVVIHVHLLSLDLSGDSEEEETLILNVADMDYSGKKTEGKGTSGKNIRSWYPMKQW